MTLTRRDGQLRVLGYNEAVRLMIERATPPNNCVTTGYFRAIVLRRLKRIKENIWHQLHPRFSKLRWRRPSLR